MPKRTLILTLLVSLVFLAACASASDSFEMPAAEPAFLGEAAEEGMAYDGDFDSSAANSARTSLQSVVAQERLIIREGNMEIVVDDTDASLAEISRLAESSGGWVVSTNLYDGGGAKSGSITIRVPVDQFDSSMARIRDMANEVRNESTNSDDVTEEYVDLDARVGNLEATADRVRNFLDQAKNVEEALAVNQELSRLEGDIESLKARMKYLSDSADFSLLVIYLTPDELAQPIEIGGWQPEGVARDAFETLVNALQGLVDILIWSGILCLPLLIIVGVPLFIIVRYYTRRRKRKAAEAHQERDTAGEEIVASEVSAEPGE